MALSNWEKTKKKYQAMSEGEFKFFVEKEWKIYNKTVKHDEDEIPFWEFFSEMECQYGRKQSK